MADLTVIEDTYYLPFNRYIDSHGLRIFVLDDVSNSFIKKLRPPMKRCLPPIA